MPFVLLFAVGSAAVGVDVGWQPLEDGSLEYIIQIEPQLLDTLKSGKEITVGVRPALRNVRRYRIVVGKAELPRIGTPTDDVAAPPSAAAAPPPVRKKSETAPVAQRSRPTDRWSATPSAPVRTPDELRMPDEFRTPDELKIANDKIAPQILDAVQPHVVKPDVKLRATDPALPLPDKSDRYVPPEVSEPSPESPLSEPPLSEPPLPDAAAPPPSGRWSPVGDRYRRRPLADEAETPAIEEIPTLNDAPPSAVTIRERPVAPAVLPANPQAWPVTSHREVAATAPVETIPGHLPVKVVEPAAPFASSDDSPSASVGSSPSPAWLPLTLTLFALFASLGGNLFLGWLTIDARRQHRGLLDGLRES